MYEMLSGLPPFYNQNQDQMMRDIVSKPAQMKPDFSPEACDLLSQLLIADPKHRLQNPREAKLHPFFRGVNWTLLEQKKIQAPFKPLLQSKTDLRNFDKQYTEEKAIDSTIQDNQWLKKNKGEVIYPGFTYKADLASINEAEEGMDEEIKKEHYSNQIDKKGLKENNEKP